MEVVNSELAVYSKSGGALLGPEATNTLWSGFGGGCQTHNDGDATVLYDTMARRWVVQQFSVSTKPYLDCVAISATSDATGSWYRYSFGFSNFPDYPKMGVWPDAYYESVNLFQGNTFKGAEMCAFNRAAMLTGAVATAQCFTPAGAQGTVLPATLDGTTAPPTGESEWFVGINPTTANALAYWKFHVDWTTPANSTLTGPTSLAVSPFSEACGGGTCIPQPGTTQQLDSLGDRLMYRLAYRNFGGHESLVVSHAITSGSSVGMRWYELRPSSGALTVFQQGTYAPDSTYRWMGSIAMDQAGDMALGYSTSSSSVHPSVVYTGRLASDALGTMPQGETTLFSGIGSQTTTLNRWGDYSEMSVDPNDDCTFWYVNEYQPSDGTFNWSTRIGSFKFPNCLSIGTVSMPNSNSTPTGVTLDTANHVAYVDQSKARAVGEITGTTASSFSGTATDLADPTLCASACALPGLAFPDNLTLDGSGHLFAANFCVGNTTGVCSGQPSGTTTTVSQQTGSSTGQSDAFSGCSYPSGEAVSGGRLFLACAGSGVVASCATPSCGLGAGTVALNKPTVSSPQPVPSGVAAIPTTISAAPAVIVADAGNHSLSVVSFSGLLAASTPVALQAGCAPANVAIGPVSGTSAAVYVACPGTGAVDVGTVSGTGTAALGTFTATALPTIGTHTPSPYGLAVNAAGTALVVTDSANNDAVVYSSLSGTTLGTGSVVSVGSVPDGVAIDGSNAFVANEGSNNVSVIDPASGGAHGRGDGHEHSAARAQALALSGHAPLVAPLPPVR
jgi:DNA-binding beta-propeller fold protein YncE